MRNRKNNKINFTIKKSFINPVYFQYLTCSIRNQIFFGGSSSGKSKFLAQRCIFDVLCQQRNYLIVRNVSASLRTSTFNEISKVILEWKADKFFNINKTDMVITCKNNYQVLFKGLDDVGKIKSITPIKGVITDIWIEEATETRRDDVKQLSKRLRGLSHVKKRLTFSFNPIMKTHWIFKEYFQSFFDNDKLLETDRQLILKTTYKDNLYLEQDDIEELEDETDSYWYEVYTLGNWGVLGSIIFNNWTVEDISKEQIDEFDNYKNGLDFGFSVDPIAFIRTHYDKKRKIIYVTKELYQLELTNPQIAEQLSPVIDKELICCDSAEPKSIKELRINGINAIGARKGKDSVLFGIQWLKQRTIIVDRQCQEFINEIQLHQWQKNRAGETLSVPVDRDNHLLDALRYAYSLEMEYSVITSVRTIRKRKRR